MRGYLFQRPGDIGIAKNLSRTRGTTLRQKYFGCVGVAAEFAFAFYPIARKDFRDGEAFLGAADRGSKNSGKFLSAKAVEQFIPPIHCAGNGDRVNAALRHFGDAFLLQEFQSEASGRPTAGIEAVQLAAFLLVYDGEEIAADAVSHGREDTSGGIGGDGGVNSVAAN